MNRRSKTTIAALVGLMLGLGGIPGCESWTMDYGKPVAQFEAADAVQGAVDYLKKKITVRGIVMEVDTSDPENCEVILQSGIKARFGKFQAAAEACKVGETVYIDGIVKSVDRSSVVLDPAFGRDPTAPFNPKKVQLKD